VKLLSALMVVMPFSLTFLAVGVQGWVGKLGDAWNLGFLAETEHQVEHHLQGHLHRLTESDTRTRAIVERMKQDEAGHADTARRLGARPLPASAITTMRLAARVMTTSSYWV
jgi:ubiquinone biosynthesis monooxygenase Coq7